ncbi:MAG: aldo/keto reductase [Spirochaetales bacterium]|nr:aldo/keto reductase [Spirochaetales bacterium]
MSNAKKTMTVKTIQLGASDLSITPVGLGCWQFAGGVGFSRMFWTPVPQSKITEIVRVSLEGGVNWFDTAEAYGRGASERALAGALAALDVAPGSVLVADKWQPFGRTARSIARTFPAREEALKPYPVDLHQVHMPVSLSSVEKQMSVMADLLDENKIKAVGVSNFSAAQMEAAHRALVKRGYRLASNQVRYHLLDRCIETNGVLSLARDLDVTIIAYSPLAQGLLTGRFHRDPGQARKIGWARRRNVGLTRESLERTRPLVEALERAGAERGAGAAEIALAWLVEKNPGRVAVIPGATRPEHARLNARALGVTLSVDEIARIDGLSAKAC